MFTGLVEEIGIMKSISQKGEAMLLTISAKVITDGMKLGDSVAVNGVCLTATSFDASAFSVDVMPQTFRNTNLKNLRPGSKVNLERAMLAGGRFGGHIVQGHVDGTGTIISKRQDQNAVVYEIEPSSIALLKYIIPKGSITVDGISLTVVQVSQGRFSISIIPHTLAETILAYKHPGDMVNLENDVIGKYVEHLLKFADISRSEAIDVPFLTQHGFM
ncbi:Riboflavin synthase [compost metagenome]